MATMRTLDYEDTDYGDDAAGGDVSPAHVAPETVVSFDSDVDIVHIDHGCTKVKSTLHLHVFEFLCLVDVSQSSIPDASARIFSMTPSEN